MNRKENCEKQENGCECRSLFRRIDRFISSIFNRDKQPSPDNPLDTFVPSEKPLEEIHIDIEIPDFLKEDTEEPEQPEEDPSQDEQQTEQKPEQPEEDPKPSNSLLDNKPFVKLFDECSSVIKDIDRLSVKHFESRETLNMMQHIESKLLSALYVAGGQPIDNNTEFDILRHSCIDRKDVPQSTPITETIRSGVILDDRVFVQAKVKVDENYIDAAYREQDNGVRRCLYCGDKIQSIVAKFCPRCGSPLPGEQTVPTPAPSRAKRPSPSRA